MIASDCSLQLVNDRHKVYELPVAALDKRGQGYRIKRLSACGGCLGDHRR